MGVTMKLRFWQREKSKEEMLNASFQKLMEEEREARGKTELNRLDWGYWKKYWKQSLCLIGGLFILLVGYYFSMIWSGQRDNIFLTICIIIMWPGGCYLIFRGIKGPEHEVVIVGSEKPSGEVNSLNIYARKNPDTGKIYPEKVAFEMILKPEGQPQQCTNNGKWYYVHIWDIAKQRLVPFALPDSQYFDPREFANVIKMPAHMKLFERQASLLQKIAPWVMVIAFFGSIIGMVMTTPA